MAEINDYRDAILDGATLAAKLERILTARLISQGYAKGQARILLSLQQDDPLTDRDVGEMIGMSSAQLSREMAVLIDNGIVQTERSPRHERQRLLSLTGEGKALVERLVAARHDAFDWAVARLSAPERRLLRETAIYRRPETRSSRASTLELASIEHAYAAYAVIESALGLAGTCDTDGLAYLSEIFSTHFRRFPIEEQSVSSVALDPMGDLIGFCLGTRGSMLDDKASDDAEVMIAALYVDPRYRRRGTAARLLKETVRRAEALTYTAISIDVPTSENALGKFLEASGFHRSSRSRRSLTDHMPRNWGTYVKTLNWNMAGNIMRL